MNKVSLKVSTNIAIIAVEPNYKCQGKLPFGLKLPPIRSVIGHEKLADCKLYQQIDNNIDDILKVPNNNQNNMVNRVVKISGRADKSVRGKKVRQKKRFNH